MSGALFTLKQASAFKAISQQGRWLQGTWMTLGYRATQAPDCRVGIRVQRGVKKAVDRNRLKRRLRAIFLQRPLAMRPGFEMMVVIRAQAAQADCKNLEQDLVSLCRQANLLS